MEDNTKYIMSFVQKDNKVAMCLAMVNDDKKLVLLEKQGIEADITLDFLLKLKQGRAEVKIERG